MCANISNPGSIWWACRSLVFTIVNGFMRAGSLDCYWDVHHYYVISGSCKNKLHQNIHKMNDWWKYGCKYSHQFKSLEIVFTGLNKKNYKRWWSDLTCTGKLLFINLIVAFRSFGFHRQFCELQLKREMRAQLEVASGFRRLYTQRFLLEFVGFF